MRSVRACTTAMAMGLLTAFPSAAATVNAGTQVVIRTYERAVLPVDLASAMAAATELFEAAGLEITWLACDAALARGGDSACMAPLAANELAIRFVRLPRLPRAADPIALGYSLVDARLRAGSLATVYIDRVAALALTCALDVGALLGRTIVHEVGHLLLGRADHARAGLMGAEWSQEALRQGRPGDWAFTPEDARAMRQAVRSRTARQLAAARAGE